MQKGVLGTSILFRVDSLQRYVDFQGKQQQQVSSKATVQTHIMLMPILVWLMIDHYKLTLNQPIIPKNPAFISCSKCTH